MIAMQVARIIAQFTVFLDFTDEDLLDIDASADAMQDLAEGSLWTGHFFASWSTLFRWSLWNLAVRRSRWCAISHIASILKRRSQSAIR
jgi:hypothetical protein